MFCIILKTKGPSAYSVCMWMNKVYQTHTHVHARTRTHTATAPVVSLTLELFDGRSSADKEERDERRTSKPAYLCQHIHACTITSGRDDIHLTLCANTHIHQGAEYLQVKWEAAASWLGTDSDKQFCFRSGYKLVKLYDQQIPQEICCSILLYMETTWWKEQCSQFMRTARVYSHRKLISLLNWLVREVKYYSLNIGISE